jgi:hypothetical protein
LFPITRRSPLSSCLLLDWRHKAATNRLLLWSHCRGELGSAEKNRKGKEEKRDFLFFAFKTFVTVPHFVLNLKLQAPCAAATVTRALYSFSALRFVPRRPMLPPPISRSCLWLKIFKKVKNCLTSRLPFARLSLLSTFATPSPIAISRDAIDRGNSTRG